MTKQVQRRRGTDSQHTSFTGADGELSVNTTNKSVHVHDGVTAGGVEAARADLNNVTTADITSGISGGTVGSLTITSADINGGTIDGVTIGGTTAGAGSFTTVTAGAGTHTIGDGTGASQIVIKASSSTAATLDFGDADDTNIGRIQYDNTTNNMLFRTNNSERLRIDSSGRLGINKSSPTSTLHVKATVDSTNGGLTLESNDGSQNATIDMNNAGNLRFYQNGNSRMRIDSSGNVGIGTSSPNGKLDVSSGNDGNSGYVDLYIGGTNASNARSGIIRKNTSTPYDMTIKSGNFSGGIPLIFDTGAGEKMRIDSSGNVGIGTSSPAAALDVVAGADERLFVTNVSGDTFLSSVNAANSAYNGLVLNGSEVKLSTNATERIRIDNLGNITAFGAGINFPVVAATFGRSANAIGFTWTSPNVYATVDNSVEMVIGTASDYRLKANDENLTGSLQTIMALRPVSYNPVDFDGVVDEDRQELGLIAHEVQAVRPSVVTGEKDAIGEDGNARYQSVNYAGLVPDLIAALQEAIAKIETLETKVAALENN